MGNNPSYNKPLFFKGDDLLPVERVSWDDAAAFCKRLSQQEGKLYRLPTEAEWEYACRAGTTTPFNTGESITTSQANYDGNYPYNGGAKGEHRGRTTRVGSFAPNAWGMHDMHGNVWEWCVDWYGAIDKAAVTDPSGPESGTERLLRGGSFYTSASAMRSTRRKYHTPDFRDFPNGFRIALDSD
jgi:formylglycine-generating enzyme required for sulfatase activity